MVGGKVGWWQDWLVTGLVGGKIGWWQGWLVARLIGGEVGWWQRGWRRRGEVSWDAFKNENPHPVGGGNN